MKENQMEFSSDVRLFKTEVESRLSNAYATIQAQELLQGRINVGLEASKAHRMIETLERLSFQTKTPYVQTALINRQQQR